MAQRRYTEKQVDAWLESVLQTYEQQAEVRARALFGWEPGTYGPQEKALDRLENVIDDIGMMRIKWREYNRMLNADASRDIRRD